MNIVTDTKLNYRYPGSRPFYDTEIDRKLFFGREREKELLLHKVLTSNIVVLYAKSGFGKTSLLNAGLSEALREKKFIPLKVRFNNRDINPLQAIYVGIKEMVEQKNLDYEKGEENSLWEYFKTVSFWEKEALLKPVLILDQFEEFFTLHSFESRSHFTQQLADVVNKTIPKILRELVARGETFPYSETPPTIRVIISIREDYLGQLEEMARYIPDILHNRFRLLPLTREQGKQAIVKPPQVKDKVIHTTSFEFVPEAVNMILDFLCERMEGGKIKMKDEVEYFQLQLLCQHFENKVRERMGEQNEHVIIQKDELGGKEGMQHVLQRFYDDQVDQLETEEIREKVRTLCEEGLISVKDRRLSQDEEEIKDQFDVPVEILQELVNRRLLRAEPWVGSTYYELSHDTLIAPIRASQKKRKANQNKVDELYQEAGIQKSLLNFEGAAQKYKEILKRDKTHVSAYMELGQFYFNRREYSRAIRNYKKAIRNEIKQPSIYYRLGQALFAAGRSKEAMDTYHELLKLGPKQHRVYEGLGDIYESRNEFPSAIENYKKALRINKENPDVHRKLSVSYIKDGKPEKAFYYYRRALSEYPIYVDIYREIVDALKERGEEEFVEKIIAFASRIGSKKASHYFDIGNEYYNLGKYQKAIENYQKVIEIDPKYASAYTNMGDSLAYLREYNEAIDAYKKAIKYDSTCYDAYYKMGITFSELENYKESIWAYQNAIEINPKFAEAYHNMGSSYYKQKKYTQVIEAYNKAIEIEPDYISPKMKLAETYLITGQFDSANAMANEGVMGEDISVDEILAMRFISITSLLFQKNKLEAVNQLKELFKYYNSLTGDYDRIWSYNVVKEFTTQNKRLPTEHTQLLAQLIDILESPKKEGDQKIKKLEKSIRQIFK